MAYRRFLMFAVGVAILSFLPVLAHAASAGGAMPWDTGLTTLSDDLTGPVAFVICLLAFFAALSSLIWMAGEMGGFVRTLIVIIMIAAALATIKTFLSLVGITGALI